MERSPWFVAACAVLWSATSLSKPLVLRPDARLSATGASRLEFVVETAGVRLNPTLIPTPDFQDTVVLTAPVFEDIRRRIPADPAATAILLLRNAAGDVLEQFEIADVAEGAPAALVARGAETAFASAGEGKVLTGPREPKMPTRADCRIAAKVWQGDNPEDWNQGRNVLLVLFNREARACFESTLLAKQGDTVLIGIVASPDDDIQAKADFSQCNREPVQPNIYLSGNPKDALKLQAAGVDFGVEIIEVRRCWDKEITVTVSVKNLGKANAPEVQGNRPISFYERYRGTLQLGVLYTDLHENDFGLRDSAGQQVIYNTESVEKGPEYVMSLVVYGFPRYFTDGAFKNGYRGRDILNEHDWLDRIGLTLIAGLDDPGDRFGIGLSFELAYGINVIWTKQWFRQRELVGLAEGDVFAGAASDITTKREWETDSSFGLSFDLRYITALFKGQ